VVMARPKEDRLDAAKEEEKRIRCMPEIAFGQRSSCDSPQEASILSQSSCKRFVVPMHFGSEVQSEQSWCSPSTSWGVKIEAIDGSRCAVWHGTNGQ